MEVTKKMNFTISRPTEFLYAIIAASLGEKVINEGNIKCSTELLESIDKMKERLSKFIQIELNYFFDMDITILDGFGQIILWNYLLDNPDINTVNELISLIENSDANIMFFYILKYMIFETQHIKLHDLYDSDKLKNDIDLILTTAKELKFTNPERKEKLIECINNPNETKQRLCLLLKQFYEKAYKPLEEDIIKTLLAPKEKYETILNSNTEKFTKEFLFKDYEVFSSIVNIHISYFRYAGSDYYSNEGNNELVVFGYKSDEFIGEVPRRENIYKFLKAISDKKRIDIIELLSQKPWYVNEIADELGMTSATASYHLTTLQELKIVDFERSDHRFYYYLNKETLNKLFDEAKELLIHE